MPLVSRIMIRLALIYLAIGIVIGGLLLINKSIDFNLKLWFLLPIHIEFLIFGWIIQFTLGTAYWMLPRLLIGNPRGNMKLANFIPICLNIGILLIVLGYLFQLHPIISIIGRIAETLAVLIFATLHWKRVSKMYHAH